MLAFLQSSLLYTGLIGFVGVTPAHPFLLILAGWVMALVFSMITYTLVVSFGEAGKALGVVLLVFQISAGGGAYPLSVLPQWFQNLSPFLPVTHATNAVRSAIGGIYQGDYWISLGQLLLFILPVLLLGLVLRRPLVGFNKDLALALEGTKLM
jgi:putative membrane protein